MLFLPANAARPPGSARDNQNHDHSLPINSSHCKQPIRARLRTMNRCLRGHPSLPYALRFAALASQRMEARAETYCPSSECVTIHALGRESATRHARRLKPDARRGNAHDCLRLPFVGGCDFSPLVGSCQMIIEYLSTPAAGGCSTGWRRKTWRPLAYRSLAMASRSAKLSAALSDEDSRTSHSRLIWVLCGASGERVSRGRPHNPQILGVLERCRFC